MTRQGPSDGVLVLRLRGDEASQDEAWSDALDALAAPSVRGGVLELGAKGAARSFARIRATRTRAEAEEIARRAQRATDRVRSLGKPVAAVLSGAIRGDVAERALACGARFLSASHETSIGLDDARWGLVPHHGGLFRLAELAGPERALLLATSGRSLSPSEAVRVRVADAALPEAELVGAARAWVQAELEKNAPRPARRSGALPLVRRIVYRRRASATLARLSRDRVAAKRVAEILAAWVERGESAARALEIESFGELAVSSTAGAALDLGAAYERARALFASPRPPLHRVAVLGDAALAPLVVEAACAGLEVVMLDDDRREARALLEATTRALDARHDEGSLSWLGRDDVLGRVTRAAEPYPPLNLILDEAPRDDHARVKARSVPSVIALRTHEERTPTDPRFAPPLPLVTGPEGLLLEVVGEAPATLSPLVARLAGATRATVIVVQDRPGFYARRLAAAYVLEASRALLEGASLEHVEEAMLDWGFGVGPFELADAWGLDELTETAEALAREVGRRFDVPTPLTRLASLGGVFTALSPIAPPSPFAWLGAPRRASMRPRRIAAPDLGARLGLDPPTLSPGPRAREPMREDVQMRVALAVVNEAAHALDEGIVTSEDDANLGAVLGAGFPALRGGPLRYAATLGHRELRARLEGYARRLGPRFAPARRFHDDRTR